MNLPTHKMGSTNAAYLYLSLEELQCYPQSWRIFILVTRIRPLVGQAGPGGQISKRMAERGSWFRTKIEQARMHIAHCTGRTTTLTSTILYMQNNVQFRVLQNTYIHRKSTQVKKKLFYTPVPIHLKKGEARGPTGSQTLILVDSVTQLLKLNLNFSE